MKLQTQRFIDRWVGQLLCGVVSGWVRLTAGPVKPIQNPRNILVILLSEMGSIVLAGPMFAQLRRQYPGVNLHILQLKKNQEVSKLLQLTDPAFMHSLDDSSGGALMGDILKVSRDMRQLGLDAVSCSHSLGSTGLMISSMMASTKLAFILVEVSDWSGLCWVDSTTVSMLCGLPST